MTSFDHHCDEDDEEDDDDWTSLVITLANVKILSPGEANNVGEKN